MEGINNETDIYIYNEKTRKKWIALRRNADFCTRDYLSKKER